MSSHYQQINTGVVQEIGMEEMGEDKLNLINQLIAKFGLNCELCFQEGEDHQQIEQQQNQQNNYREVGLIAAKVTSIQPEKKSYIVVCDYHFQKIEPIFDQLTEKIKYSAHKQEIKKAKHIKICNLDVNQKILNNYCCRILKCLYSNIEKQIQRLNFDNFSEIAKHTCEQKIKNLQLTKTKFMFYIQNQQKMTLRQHFLVYHFYKRLENKKLCIIDNFLLNPKQHVETISQSISAPISQQI